MQHNYSEAYAYNSVRNPCIRGKETATANTITVFIACAGFVRDASMAVQLKLCFSLVWCWLTLCTASRSPIVIGECSSSVMMGNQLWSAPCALQFPGSWVARWRLG